MVGSTNRTVVVLLALAALWAALLPIGAATLPFYSSSSGTSRTLVEENGPQALAIAGAPLVVVGVVALSIAHKRRTRRPGPGAVAWVGVGVLGAISLLGILTIGIFLAPVAILAAVACGIAST